MYPKESGISRSENMSRIRSTNTSIELSVRKYLHAQGLRYRVNDSRLIGRPDIYLPKYKTAIFVHGCFWHGHNPCHEFRLPKSNTEFWRRKISANRKRDYKVQRMLSQQGIFCYVIWSCKLHPRLITQTMAELMSVLSNRLKSIHQL